MSLLIRRMIELAVLHARARTHALHISGRYAFDVAHAVFVREFAAEHITDDFHVLVTVRAKASAGLDTVFIDDPQIAPSHVRWVVIVSKRKAVKRLQPAMVCITSVIRFAQYQHVGTSQLHEPNFKRSDDRARAP